MEDTVLRIKKICEAEGLSREGLAEITGISYSRWTNLMNARGKIRSDEIEIAARAWPEYKYWIAFGEELPEAGQISPMTKAAQESLKTQGKAGA